ncbi:uncharacterized protein BJ212DRAFT_1363463 [Suillus subaureus]|uniref:Uncharacterized protein n=1 Tax=Suillus subaureus TaxID=48587 RepID=A0A9P7E958_9AGAM|nr:uncharacterized protein BJ212DRAFT_1363463 [Suillus subaureus]KAG1814391.1 hypothetical protein BJ212DRAFT_1363463 [Suillus subaureus]
MRSSMGRRRYFIRILMLFLERIQIDFLDVKKDEACVWLGSNDTHRRISLRFAVQKTLG